METISDYPDTEFEIDYILDYSSGCYYREYNELNQLIRVRNGSNSSAPILEEYDYDYLGNRIMIQRFDSANTTVYTPWREWTRIINSSGTYDFTYIYDGSTFVARINPDGNKSYFHDDHLGSVSLITNQSGAIIEQTFFEPFGSVTSGGIVEDKLYTGQFSDDLTGQYYYGTRYYIPKFGQFGQPDPEIQSVYDTQALNHYAYARNNPYLFVDPNGRDFRVFADLNAAYGVGHIMVAVDDPQNPDMQYMFENEGMGTNVQIKNGFGGEYLNSKYPVDRVILSFTGKYEAKTSVKYEPIRDENGNVIIPTGYGSYFEVEQDESLDQRMIDEGERLVANSFEYSAFKQNSFTFAKTILAAGNYRLSTDYLILPNVAYVNTKIFGSRSNGGRGPTSNSDGYFINPRTGAKVPLLPGEGYNKDKDEIVR